MNTLTATAIPGLIRVCASAVCVLLLGPGAWAQQAGWKPEKGVEFIAAGGAGGGLDLICRTMQTILKDRNLINVPVTVVNKPGAGNALGYAYVNQHAGDAHYILVTGPNIVTNRITGSNPIDFSEMTPIATLSSESVAITVKADSAINSGADLISRLRKDPASVTFGVAPNIGSSNHLAASLLMKGAGVDIRKAKFVLFPGSGQSAMAAMGGHIDVNVSSSAQVAPHVAGKKLKILGVTSAQRLGGVFANVPTWKEQGVGIDYGSWRVIVGPRGMTEAQIAYWERLFASLVDTADWKQSLERHMWVSIFRNHERTKAFLQSQRESLGAILRELDLAKGN